MLHQLLFLMKWKRYLDLVHIRAHLLRRFPPVRATQSPWPLLITQPRNTTPMQGAPEHHQRTNLLTMQKPSKSKHSTWSGSFELLVIIWDSILLLARSVTRKNQCNLSSDLKSLPHDATSSSSSYKDDIGHRFNSLPYPDGKYLIERQAPKVVTPPPREPTNASFREIRN